MLTENRKRQRSGEDQPNGQLVPQAKRPSRAHPLSPETGRDACDPESNSESSGISSPEHLVGSCSSQYSAVDPLAGQRVVPGSRSPLLDSCSSSGSASSAAASSSELLLSYHQINRILREAHFQSLHSRGQHADT